MEESAGTQVVGLDYKAEDLDRIIFARPLQQSCLSNCVPVLPSMSIFLFGHNYNSDDEAAEDRELGEMEDKEEAEEVSEEEEKEEEVEVANALTTL